jgi:Pvc16 N-terminal domain
LSSLTIAAVTAILKSKLENGLVSRGVTPQLGGDATVTALAPDRVGGGAEEKPHLNIFLYSVAPNTGLSAASRQRTADATRQANTITPLELHYLVSAYGAQDYQVEILIGYCLDLMRKSPEWSQESIASALKALSNPDGGRNVPAALAAMHSNNVAAQIDRVRITPHFMNADELAKLFSALQSRYRPSIAYRLTVVPAGWD